MGQMEQSTKATLESKDIDLQHSSPSLSPQDNELVARADEQLAHAYEQIASADEQLARLHTTVLRFEQEDARHELSSARDRPALRGMIGLLLTGCILVAAFVAHVLRRCGQADDLTVVPSTRLSSVASAGKP